MFPGQNFIKIAINGDNGRKQVEEFLNVVGIIFPIKHWNCADNQNNSGFVAESSFQ